MGRPRPIKNWPASRLIRIYRRTVSVRNICPHGTSMPHSNNERRAISRTVNRNGERVTETVNVRRKT